MNTLEEFEEYAQRLVKKDFHEAAAIILTAISRLKTIYRDYGDSKDV